MEELEVNKVNDLAPSELSEKDLSKEEAMDLMNDPSSNINKPSEEEILAAQEEFQSRAQKFQVKGWDIGDSEIAETHIEYLNHFIEHRAYWVKQGWMGLIKMKEEIDATKATFSVEKGDKLRLTYQPLVFTYHMLSSPGGVGHASAVNFEEEAEQYGKLFADVEIAFKLSQEELKEIQFLQEKWAAYSQGFYYEKDEVLEEPPVGGVLDDSIEVDLREPEDQLEDNEELYSEEPDVTDHLEEDQRGSGDEEC